MKDDVTSGSGYCADYNTIVNFASKKIFKGMLGGETNSKLGQNKPNELKHWIRRSR